jgi:hypothetical protein
MAWRRDALPAPRVHGGRLAGASERRPPARRLAIGRAGHRRSRALGLAALGLLGAGLVIMLVGMTRVFVPQDLAFMQLTRDQIHALSPHLVPVIAHDRAGFGGGLFSMGLVVAIMTRHAPLTRSFVEIVALMGAVGFGATLGVHFAIGYTDAVHLAPAYAGAGLFVAAIACLAQARRRAR